MVLVAAGFIGWREYRRLVRDEPERFPWTALSLADPIGDFTGRKLAALAGKPERCETLLQAVAAEDKVVGARRGSDVQCSYASAIALRPANPQAIRFAPAGVVTACPVAAALHVWERDIVQPAALRHYGARVGLVDHLGSYSCRRLYGRSEGAFSEHASANAIDIAGFRLADGRRVTVLRDWSGAGSDPSAATDAAFLREVRDGACALFATVLSPDYNAAHADHLHFDQAARGATGWRGCR